MNPQPQQGICPVCDAQITLRSDAVVSEILSCPDCSVDLEIRSLAPITLAEAPSEDEDWGE